MNELSTGTKAVIGGIAIFAVFIIILIFFPVVVIGAGERGVVFNNASGVEDRILGEGVHFRIPLIESVISMPIKVQKSDVKAEAASADLQTVATDIVVNWKLDGTKVNKIYQEVGDEKAILDKIINPAVSEVVKAATAKKTAEEIIKLRPQLKDDIDTALKERLAKYNVLLDGVSIVNVDFSKEFNAAIEAKQVAEQESQKAQFIANKAIKEAEAMVNAAKGQAEAQRLVQQTITPELLQKMAIEKWNGNFPQYFGGGVLPFINLK